MTETGDKYTDFIAFREILEHNSKRHNDAVAMPCGHPCGCIGRDEDGVASCAWCREVARLRELIPDAGMLHRLTYAAEQWWEGQGEQVQKDIEAGYALVERLHEEAK